MLVTFLHPSECRELSAGKARADLDGIVIFAQHVDLGSIVEACKEEEKLGLQPKEMEKSKKRFHGV